MSLYAISYTSSAVLLPTDQQLETLLHKARARNLREQVTGALLYAEGTFHQYIEGPEASVLRVYDLILRDPMHHRIFEMVREPIDAREFPGWSMAFRDTALVRGAPADGKLIELLADPSDRLTPGRLLLNAFWCKSAGGRHHAAFSGAGGQPGIG
jgi:hypothetical protein